MEQREVEGDRERKNDNNNTCCEECVRTLGSKKTGMVEPNKRQCNSPCIHSYKSSTDNFYPILGMHKSNQIWVKVCS